MLPQVSPWQNCFPPSHPKTSVDRAAECIQICKSSHQDRSKADAALHLGSSHASLDSSALGYAALPKDKHNFSASPPFQALFLPFYQQNPNTICFPRGSAPIVLWDTDPQTTARFPNQKWVKPKSLKDLVQTSLCKPQTKLLWFVKQARNLPAAPSYSRNSMPSFFVPTDGYLPLNSSYLHCWNT